MEFKSGAIDLTCPCCKKGGEIAADLEITPGLEPVDGMVIICPFCQSPNLFTSEGNLRAITEEDRAEGTDLHRAWPKIMELAGLVASFRAQTGGASA